MLDIEDVWFFYHVEAREQIDLCYGDEDCGKCLQHSGVEAWPDMGKLSGLSCLGPVYISLLWNSKIIMKI